MRFKNTNVPVPPEVRKRVTDGDYQIPITINFDNVSDKVDGVKVVKVGTPISKDGEIATANAKGILVYADVYETRPIGTILTHGHINVAVAEKWSGKTITDAVKQSLPMVVFE